MHSDQYRDLALLTESKVFYDVVDSRDVNAILLIFAQAAQMIDHLKRAWFYGRPYDRERILTLLDTIESFAAVPADAPDLIDPIINARLLHGVCGVATEAGELVEILMRKWHHEGGRDLALVEEMGDLSWYENLLLDVMGVSREVVLDANIAKLRARYSNQFDAYQAAHRNIEGEQAALAESIDAEPVAIDVVDPTDMQELLNLT